LYFNFFLSELPKFFPYVGLFPWTAATLFSASNHHPALRHSVLSVAALLRNREEVAGRLESFHHLQEALKLLQNRISSHDVDESVAISSFLLSYLSLIAGDLDNANTHLRGMLLVFDQLEPGMSDISESVISPLTRLIWRMAIRIDFILSIAFGQAPVLPRFIHIVSTVSYHSPPDEDKEAQIAWIQSYAGKDYSAHCAEWAEAWFALDALMHKTCHVAALVNLLPVPRSDSQVAELTKPIVDEHRKWQERLILVQANEMERIGELSLSEHIATPLIIPALTAAQIQFLDHSSIHITDSFFACRLNNWRAIGLYLSLIHQPLWGMNSGKELVNALDICRTYAAIRDSEDNFLGAAKAIELYLAGVLFGGPDMYSVTAFTASLIEERIGMDSGTVKGHCFVESD
jgi:hypothetical protein